jgi:hypothetical protein
VGPEHQRRERGGRDTLSGLYVAGPRGDSSAGPNRSPWPFILFLISFLVFSFSYFLFLFLSFAKMLQTNSNFFLKFSKIQHIVLSHPVTCFQNKYRVLGKTSYSSKEALLA